MPEPTVEVVSDGDQEWASELSVGHPMLDVLIRSNSERIQQLAQSGVGIDITAVMMQHLLNTLFPELPDRQAYEFAFQRFLTEQLIGIEAMVAEQLAAQTFSVPPQGLFIPGQ